MSKVIIRQMLLLTIAGIAVLMDLYEMRIKNIYCRADLQYMVRKPAWYSAVCSWYGCADCASGMAVLFSNAGYR